MKPRYPDGRWIALLLAALLVTACGDSEEKPAGPPPPGQTGPGAPPPEALPDDLDAEPTILDHVQYAGALTMTGPEQEDLPPEVRDTLVAVLSSLEKGPPAGTLTIDYPLPDSVFPPEIVAPSILWHDDAPAADLWLVDAAFADGRHQYALASGAPPPMGEIDPEAVGPTNEVYMGTPYQQSGRSFTPVETIWAEIKEQSTDAPATLAITGFSHKHPEAPVSHGSIRITTSKDPVGARIFYRDVPLMPNEGKPGIITPLAKTAMPLICWRIRDLSQTRGRVVLRDMPTCANCHSFSLDGKTMGMDVDGPHGDKGTYMISPVEKKMVIEADEIISWNEYPAKPEGHKTIGFLSRISPDGRYAITTLNEALYVNNFINYKFLQVFYPTRGILAVYDTQTAEMTALPGADDPQYVHTNGVWSPDGKWIVFSRAGAKDPLAPGQTYAERANDPSETQIQYDLYRIPFNGGKGGTPLAIEGASANGMSNTFPKVSPDGKWIVFTQCKNGQLMRPDSRLWILPFEGGEAREMQCNTSLMNSWHSISPNSRWMVFSSKANTPYTQMFLTHIDEDGNSTPPILVPNSTAANRAVNIPEFLNGDYEDLQEIQIPAVKHHRHFTQGMERLRSGDARTAIDLFQKALDEDPNFLRAHLKRGEVLVKLGRRKEALAHYLRVLEEEPRNTDARMAAAGLLHRLGRREEAMEYYRLAMADEEPGGPAAGSLYSLLRQRGLKLSAAGDVDGAVKAMREALEFAPKDTQLREELLDVLTLARRERAARDVMLELLEIDPKNAQLMTGLAWRLATHPEEDLRDAEGALRWADEAVRLTEGRDAVALGVLGVAHAAAGRYPEAVAETEKALHVEGIRKRLRRDLQDRLELYRAGKPLVVPLPR